MIWAPKLEGFAFKYISWKCHITKKKSKNKTRVKRKKYKHYCTALRNCKSIISTEQLGTKPSTLIKRLRRGSTCTKIACTYTQTTTGRILQIKLNCPHLLKCYKTRRGHCVDKVVLFTASLFGVRCLQPIQLAKLFYS